MPTFFHLLVLFLELSGRCGASSRRSCGNVTFSAATTHHTFQIVLARVPVDEKRLAFSFSVAYLKMTGATRPNVVLCKTDCWFDEKKGISNEYPARTDSEITAKFLLSIYSFLQVTCILTPIQFSLFPLV